MTRRHRIYTDEIREFSVKLYYHSAKFTISPEMGIFSIPVKCTLWRTTCRGAKQTWNLEALQITNKEAWDLFLYDRKHGATQYDPLAIAVMVELFKHGIDPLEVRGWGKYVKGKVRQRAEAGFIQWRDKHYDAAAD